MTIPDRTEGPAREREPVPAREAALAALAGRFAAVGLDHPFLARLHEACAARIGVTTPGGTP